MQHAKFNAGSFYINPYRDVLWLTDDIIAEPECIEDIKNHYGDQLRHIRNAMVEECEWASTTPATLTWSCLYPFNNMNIIFILYGDYDSDCGKIVIPERKERISLTREYKREYARFAREAKGSSGLAKRLCFITKVQSQSKLEYLLGCK